jgi:hypothetical protein
VKDSLRTGSVKIRISGTRGRVPTFTYVELPVNEEQLRRLAIAKYLGVVAILAAAGLLTIFFAVVAILWTIGAI